MPAVRLLHSRWSYLGRTVGEDVPDVLPAEEDPTSCGVCSARSREAFLRQPLPKPSEVVDLNRTAIDQLLHVTGVGGPARWEDREVANSCVERQRPSSRHCRIAQGEKRRQLGNWVVIVRLKADQVPRQPFPEDDSKDSILPSYDEVHLVLMNVLRKSVPNQLGRKLIGPVCHASCEHLSVQWVKRRGRCPRPLPLLCCVS